MPLFDDIVAPNNHIWIIRYLYVKRLKIKELCLWLEKFMFPTSNHNLLRLWKTQFHRQVMQPSDNFTLTNDF